MNETKLSGVCISSVNVAAHFHASTKRVIVNSLTTEDARPDIFLNALQKCQHLHTLHVSSTYFLSDNYSKLFTKVLYRAPVVELSLRSQMLKHKDLRYIRKGLATCDTLKKLTIFGCSQADPGFCEYLTCSLDFMKLDIGMAETIAYILLARSISSGRVRIREIKISTTCRASSTQFRLAGKWLYSGLLKSPHIDSFLIMGFNLNRLGYDNDYVRSLR